MNHRRSSRLPLAGWLLCLLGGAASTGIIVAGLLRDTHFEEAKLAVDLGRPSSWQGADFRIWEDGAYAVWLSSLGPQPPYDPSRSAVDEPAPIAFAGRIELRVLDPDGTPVHEVTYTGTAPPHVVREGMTWTRLADLELRGSPSRAWRLEARVQRPDRGFTGRSDVRSEILLRRDREPVGMGGLLNYAMMIPAAVLLFASLGFGLAAAHRGASRVPAWISGIAVAILGLWLMR